MDANIIMLLLSLGITIVIGIISLVISRKYRTNGSDMRNGFFRYLNIQQTTGDIFILMAFVLSSLICILVYWDKCNWSLEMKKIIVLIFTSLAFGILALFFELKKASGRKIKFQRKMIGSIIISICFIFYTLIYARLNTEIMIPFLKIHIELPILLYVVFIVLVLLITIKMTSLTCEIEGLMPISSIILITCLTAIGIIQDIKEVIIFGCISLGVCFGLLIFNLKPAKILIGEVGSFLFGGVIGMLTVYLKIPLIIFIVEMIPILGMLFYRKILKERNYTE